MAGSKRHHSRQIQQARAEEALVQHTILCCRSPCTYSFRHRAHSGLRDALVELQCASMAPCIRPCLQRPSLRSISPRAAQAQDGYRGDAHRKSRSVRPIACSPPGGNNTPSPQVRLTPAPSERKMQSILQQVSHARGWDHFYPFVLSPYIRSLLNIPLALSSEILHPSQTLSHQHRHNIPRYGMKEPASHALAQKAIKAPPSCPLPA